EFLIRKNRSLGELVDVGSKPRIAFKIPSAPMTRIEPRQLVEANGGFVDSVRRQRCKKLGARDKQIFENDDRMFSGWIHRSVGARRRAKVDLVHEFAEKVGFAF